MRVEIDKERSQYELKPGSTYERIMATSMAAIMTELGLDKVENYFIRLAYADELDAGQGRHESVLGLVVNLDDEQTEGPILMGLRKGPLYQMILSLGHELVHVKQAIFDNLRVHNSKGVDGEPMYNVFGDDGKKWRGMELAMLGFLLGPTGTPWEKEAHGRMDDLFLVALEAQSPEDKLAIVTSIRKYGIRT